MELDFYCDWFRVCLFCFLVNKKQLLRFVELVSANYCAFYKTIIFLYHRPSYMMSTAISSPDIMKPKCFQFSAHEPQNIDWNNRGTFANRFADAFMGKALRSDMSFYLESARVSITAHTLIVSAASEVLDRIIFGSGSIANFDRVVKVPNCPDMEFRVLLKYLYTGIKSLILL